MSERAWQSWVEMFSGSGREAQESLWAQLTEEQKSFLGSQFRIFGPRGFYHGKYYWHWKLEIERLKRAGRDQAALLTLKRLLDAARADGRGSDEDGPLPVWYYEQLAILYRKLKQYDEEVRYLEELAACEIGRDALIRSMILKRISKAIQLAGAGKAADLRDHPIFSRTLAVVDVETTGFSRNDELIELAILKAKVSELEATIEVLDQYSGLREPGVPIQPKAQRVHGLTMADLAGRQLDLARVETLLTAADFLVSHNAAFDRRFVATVVPQSTAKPWLCTMNGIDWLTKGFPDKKLSQLLSSHEIFPDAHHRALSDAGGLIELLRQKDRTNGQPYVKELLTSRPLSAPETREPADRGPRRMRIEIDLTPKQKQTTPAGCASMIVAIAILAGVLLLQW